MQFKKKEKNRDETWFTQLPGAMKLNLKKEPRNWNETLLRGFDFHLHTFINFYGHTTYLIINTNH